MVSKTIMHCFQDKLLCYAQRLALHLRLYVRSCRLGNVTRYAIETSLLFLTYPSYDDPTSIEEQAGAKHARLSCSHEHHGYCFSYPSRSGVCGKKVLGRGIIREYTRMVRYRELVYSRRRNGRRLGAGSG